MSLALSLASLATATAAIAAAAVSALVAASLAASTSAIAADAGYHVELDTAQREKSDLRNMLVGLRVESQRLELLDVEGSSKKRKWRHNGQLLQRRLVHSQSR